MIIKEYPLQAQTYQEFEVPRGTNFINVLVKSSDEIVLVAETTEQDPIESYLIPEEDRNIDTIGVYVLPSNQVIEDELLQNFIYLNTIAMNSDLGVLLFHVYLEDIECDIPDLFDRLSDEEEIY